MKQSVIGGCVATVALALGTSLGWAIPTFNRTRRSPVVPPRAQLVLPPSPVAGSMRSVDQAARRIYQTIPYSILVYVPKEVDPRMIYWPDISGFAMPSYCPPLLLEKR